MYQNHGNLSQPDYNTMALGTASGGSLAKVEQPSIMASVTRDVQNHNTQLVDLLVRARSIADDVFGMAPPTADAANTPETPTVGKADAASRAMADQNKLISSLRLQIDRLTCI